MDIGLFNNRLNVTVDMYKDITKDLILQINLPSNSGYDNQYQNLGQTTNRGIELSLNGTIVDTKDLYIAANFNIAFNRNRVDALDGNSVMIHSSGSSADRCNCGNDRAAKAEICPCGNVHQRMHDPDASGYRMQHRDY